jgi:hypothetical protein
MLTFIPREINRLGLEELAKAGTTKMRKIRRY